MGPDFTEEQKRYLEGFFAGLLTRRGAGTGSPPTVPGANGAAAMAPAEPAPAGPEAIHRAAQDRFLSAGKKLTAEEMAKRARNPLDMWEEMRANAEAGRFPKGTDVFLHKFHGLFYVAPAQDAFMCRLRIPNGILNAHQLHDIADVAQRCAGGYADVTTRANLQLREIGPKSILDVLTAIQELGLTTRGAGADNLRNITGSPTAGIDPEELIDTRPLCRELHYTILQHRELYGLPRKFNIGFDGGGSVSVLEDTNDIGFAAVAVGEGEA
ncbi:MAG TPA: NirA family protein, partial [Xanthobacteraceae bacterium]|nr:NirA family protein [Xanthobacteraceae bacterium]